MPSYLDTCVIALTSKALVGNDEKATIEAGNGGVTVALSVDELGEAAQLP